MSERFTTFTDIDGELVTVKSSDIRNITSNGVNYKVCFNDPSRKKGYTFVDITKQEAIELADRLIALTYMHQAPRH
jgi:hypothetical protein